MAENLENSENALQPKDQYLYGGFQRICSYDPNMCTTAARFDPYFEKGNASKTKTNSETNYKKFVYDQPSGVEQHRAVVSNSLHHDNDASKTADPSYLSYNNEMLIEQQNDVADVFKNTRMERTVAVNEKDQNVSALCDDVGIDYIQQIDQGIDEVTGEPITTNIVLRRSPNGHLYQNLYVTNDDGTPGEMVELVPIDNCESNHLDEINADSYSLQPYEFPSECNIEALEAHLQTEHQGMDVIDEENQKQMLIAQMLEKAQQRILLESTMSPLLAAVNDITQRDAELNSYLNQQVEKSHDFTEKVYDKDVCRTEFDTHITKDSSEEDDDYNKPVETRARASLPNNYLYLGNVNTDTNEPSVYARKSIPHRTKFGPFEGEIRFTSDVFLNILRSQQPRHFPLLLVGKSRVLIVTNENTSNWMRFVRLAHSYAEQNLQLIEEEDRIYFKCNRSIHPKEELRVGYHRSYALKYNLSILEPSVEDTQKKYELSNPWMCFECDQRFPTAQEMQKHLEVHDIEDATRIISKKKIKRKQKQIKKLSELPKNSSRCLICFKVFMTNASLKKHFVTHLAANKSRYKSSTKLSTRSLQKCQLCHKKFLSEKKFMLHQDMHLNNELKPHKCPHCDQHCATPTALAAHVRSHTNRLYSCVFCQQTFKYVMDFKKHVVQHSTDGLYCCVHCKKTYKEYHLLRKHIRIFHPAVKYPCNECDRLFMHMSFLRRHKATHAKQTVHQCSQCEEKFKRTKDLSQHRKTVHKTKRNFKQQKAESPVINEDPQPLQLTPKKKTSLVPGELSPRSLADYSQYQFKCDDCKVGFKRRGMLVNHIVKRHPDRNIDAIDELNQPIIKLQTVFNCLHCSKVYKNNAKRKAHILKNHPGMEIPPSFRSNPILSDGNVQTVGCIKTDVQKCQLCYKQYASRTRLLTHYRKAHINERVPEIPLAESPPSQILIEEQCVGPVMDIHRPPVSPENKLLKLSSAALELSSIEDRKYFDFLNERSDTNDIPDSSRSNFKIVESEFGETSSNTELHRLPELFEESIACI